MAQNLRTNGLKNARLSTKAIGGGARSCAEQRSFCELATEKAKCYMNFSAPEKILILNLRPQLGQQFNFSQALCQKYYHSKRLDDQTCQKNGFENARPFHRIHPGGGARSCAEQRSFCELASAKSEMLYHFFCSRENSYIESSAAAGPTV